ncbi:hypothetical protein FB451DRAFT_1393705 [Mycena latifolia]|nr:hypothetical protein FB451DRAFT_1393705 [Mycena latifolia]
MSVFSARISLFCDAYPHLPPSPPLPSPFFPPRSDIRADMSRTLQSRSKRKLESEYTYSGHLFDACAYSVSFADTSTSLRAYIRLVFVGAYTHPPLSLLHPSFLDGAYIHTFFGVYPSFRAYAVSFRSHALLPFLPFRAFPHSPHRPSRVAALSSAGKEKEKGREEEEGMGTFGRSSGRSLAGSASSPSAAAASSSAIAAAVGSPSRKPALASPGSGSGSTSEGRYVAVLFLPCSVYLPARTFALPLSLRLFASSTYSFPP